MSRLLVTGASGLLGANVALAAAAEGHEVTGTYHTTPAELPRVTMVACDLTAGAAAEDLVAAARPDWIVHCAAAADVDRCESEPAWAEQLNREAAQRVARAARRSGAALVHISTDAVFDGATGGYREDDPPRPINVYGRTKLEGERAVSQEHPKAVIVRTNFFGWSPRRSRSLAEWFLARLQEGTPSPGFTDVFFSPLPVTRLARVMLGLLEAGEAGLFHLAGRTCLSKYEFGVRLAEAFGFPADLVRPKSVATARLRAARPLRLCLACDRIQARSEGALPDIAQAIAEFRGLVGSGYALAPRSPLGRRFRMAAT